MDPDHWLTAHDDEMGGNDDHYGHSSSPTVPMTPTAGGRPEQRTTRSATGALKSNKPPPKLKLKLGESKGNVASGMSFLGPYDRELDSDFEEDLVFEEQFILRVPEGEACERIRKLARERDAAPDVWFKFRDPRRGVFNIGNTTFQAKLVDLPCVVEAQKTLDKKQLFKVADICQMVVLSTGTEDTDDFKVDDFIWPHGITPPLKHVRKRRFRKRINKRTIETVEQEVERLFETDAAADSVQFDVLEGVNPDLSDSEFIERDDPATPAAPEDAATPMGDMDGDEGGDGEEEDEDAMDAEFAAELHRAMEEGSSGEDDAGEESDPSEDEDGEDEDEEGEDDEFEQGRKRLNEEIRDLEAAVAKKHAEISTSANPLVKKRFEDALRKLQSDLEMKQAQREAIAEERARRKEQRARAEDMDDDEGDGADEEADDDEAEAEVAVGVYDAAQQMDEDVDPIFGADDA